MIILIILQLQGFLAYIIVLQKGLIKVPGVVHSTGDPNRIIRAGFNNGLCQWIITLNDVHN